MKTYMYGDKWKFHDPSPEMIDSAIDELLPVKNDFVVLVSKERVENCDFIQTTIRKDDCDTELTYQVEVRFQYTKEYPGDFKQHKLYTTDLDYVKKMFRMFALEVIPDVTGWIDITEELKEEKQESH